MNEMIPAPKEQGVAAWLNDWIANGRLPGAVKAIAHVVGMTGETASAYIDIAKAKAEQISQGIRDETSARTIIRSALVESAKIRLPEDKDLAERAINTWIGSEMRKQNNREHIAALAAEELSRDIPDAELAPPDEDWLDLFGNFAEKASTEAARDLWSRVLSGEIRKPGSFSRRTLQIISVLDYDTAKKFESISNLVLNYDHILNDESFKSGERLEIVRNLMEFGIIDYVMNTNMRIESDDKHFHLMSRNFTILIRSDSKIILRLPAIKLTRAGREIYKLIDVVGGEPEMVAAAKFVRNNASENVRITVHKSFVVADDKFKFDPEQIIFEA